MAQSKKAYPRFNILQRIEHIVLILTFTTLAVTGLAQKFSQTSVAISIITFLGGIQITRIIHRTAAVIFMLQSIYHLIEIGYKLYVQRKEPTMLPGYQDLRDFIQNLLYNLGLAKERPKMGRYNFGEKMEYWALVWGLAIMAITGFMMWNPIRVTDILPGQFVPAAKAAHGAEAILAVLAIIIWHFYNVHIKHWNASMFTGKMSRDQMEEEHELEMEEMDSGGEKPLPPAPEIKKRQAIYFPIAGIVTVLLVFGVYRFVSLEQTALTTIPPVQGLVSTPYSRQTPTPLATHLPTTTPAPTLPGSPTLVPMTWNTGISAILQARCGTCHGETAMGELSVLTYADIMKGGLNGPVIVPGDPQSSPLVTMVQGGNHPGKLLDAELQLVMLWIRSGAGE